ncbi:inhibitor of nuclear factor kappa-B kinase subunit alpha [Anopheles bellator]|uniref:inhibitor of nuclear factor kappa-B kinase subunit alpha n=1 Tax=Anopheles bellator TaxID=139047 RepID=UPI002648A42C|nr:inhibitor of nuclear factor kappa-B kinase subunit alpha [Anopheles bellator]
MLKPFEDPPAIGDWLRERRLGNGGFGVVSLWRNRKTQQTVAIKKFHMLQDKSEITDKHCERWRNEVRLMTETVRNDNIVRTVAVKPDSFVQELLRRSANGLPVLCMEYCEGGDLRRVLNRVENCSGLPEQEVREVLRSLRNAISYLHSLKITHRDIKPENLVLKQQGDRFVYKLTDLGYAKALDKQSLNASLVGTVEYIAPDLIYCDRYNNSVDYWSMGVIAFEIVTGVRPFIPHSPITKWMLHVQQKKPADIAITEDNRENYTYHSDIFPENHISDGLRKQLERWLVLALEWNPKMRGFAPDTTTPATTKVVKFAEDSKASPSLVLKIFSLLDQLLERKFLTLFSLYDCRWMSVEVTEDSTMATVRHEVYLATGIPANEIEFILPLEQKRSRIVEGTRPVDLWLPGVYGDERPMLFVIHGGSGGAIVQRDLKPRIPTSITDVFQNIKVKLKPHILRQFSANAYHFIAREERQYVLLLDGIRNYGLLLNDGIAGRRDEINRMNKIVYGILGGVEYHKLTISHARDSPILRRQIASSQFDAACNEWEDNCTRLESNVRKVAEMADKICKRYDSVLKRSRDALRHPLLVRDSDLQQQQQPDYFGLKNVEGRYEQTRARIMERITNDKTHMDMSQAVYECLKRRDVLLRDPPFLELQQQLLDIRHEMQEIEKVLQKMPELTEKFKRDLARLTLLQQDGVWKLQEGTSSSGQNSIVIPNGCVPSMETTNSGSSVPDLDRILPRTSNGTPKFLLGGPMTPLHAAHGSDATPIDENLLCFGEGPNVDDLISANATLIMTTNDLLSDSFTMLQK